MMTKSELEFQKRLEKFIPPKERLLHVENFKRTFFPNSFLALASQVQAVKT